MSFIKSYREGVIVSLTYELIRKFSQTSEKLIATFSDKTDATEFMKYKAKNDNQLKVGTEYLLREDDMLVDKIVSADFTQPSALSSTTTTSSSSGFNPNPFSTTAQPPGMKSSFTDTNKDPHDEDI